MKRIRLQNDTHLIEWADNNGGRLQAEAFRKNHPEFKGRKIRSILQLRPSEVPCGEILPFTGKTVFAAKWAANTSPFTIGNV